eukprot:CAMPEP_0197859568 /NCGR_PEP_ID=MMETSP1438-20131217/34219_1 /TAXON_ID=1461541 /ORGANISM="Pterosperma sp., Strain CCMP1384" /LENGTH=68 /DNA_ID=CAMNT_0043476097 /DNA_START=12 /DNA_END=218 /DNA_ORIENTATION=-
MRFRSNVQVPTFLAQIIPPSLASIPSPKVQAGSGFYSGVTILHPLWPDFEPKLSGKLRPSLRDRSCEL